MCTGFKAQGHAGFSEYGKDIVCAAISALTQATAQGVTEVAKAKAKLTVDDDKGLLELEIVDDSEEALKKAQILLKTLELALTSISQDEQYTGTVRIIYRERR